MLLILLIILIVLALFGGFGYSDGAYRNSGVGVAALLLILLLFMAFTGAIDF